MWLIYTTCCFCLISGSLANPSVVIKTGVSHANEHAQQQDAGIHDTSGKVGISNFEAADGFNLDNEKKYVSQEDAGKYGEENVDKKHHVDGSEYTGQKFHDQTGGTVADLANKIAHKKGHHRSGFHNSYHKDESGSNTSFYDDGDDHGNEYIQQTRKGLYGDTARQDNQGSHLDGTHYEKEQGRHGGYNNGENYQRGQGNRRNYGQERYNDDRAVHGNSNAGNRFGEVARREDERYHSRPLFVGHHRPNYYPDEGYYGGQPYIAPSKKTITIYEDPRYADARYDPEPQYSDDYVTLDVKRAPAPTYYDYRYYDQQQQQRPVVDYYY